VETDAADGNRLRTRIPTAAWKAQNAFHSFPTRPDGGSIIGFTFRWAEGGGAPQTSNSKCANFKLSQQRGSPQRRVPALCSLPAASGATDRAMAVLLLRPFF
jgi:hypothetical protein